MILQLNQLTKGTLFVLTSLHTLGATAGTFFVVSKWLEPLNACRSALEKYSNGKTSPELPEQYTDEGRILMKR